jgi:amino acid transporter
LALVLSGAVHFKKFEGVGDPLAFIFEQQNLNVGWMQLLVSFCAVIAMTSVLLVFQMGQPRMWMSISRDGLLPDTFQKLHPKYKTPSYATIMTGLVVGIPILFTDKTFVLDFTSIATLFAFVLVCGGILLIPRREKNPEGFNMPFVNSRFIFPALVLGSFALVMIKYPSYFSSLFNFNMPEPNYSYNISTLIFWIICIILSFFAFKKQWSLIPLLGLSTCLYLLTGMTALNWAWFSAWLVLGLIIYFTYSYKNSKLHT